MIGKTSEVVGGVGKASRNRANAVLPAFAMIAVLFAGFGILAAQEPSAVPTSNGSPESKTSQAMAAPSNLLAVPDNYLIKPGDSLNVIVFEEPQLSSQCAVSQSGTITLPLMKPLKAEGTTPTELAEIITRNLQEAGLLSHPQVTVTVQSTPWSVVTVEGAVRNPRTIPIVGRANLLYVISQAGGLADDAGDRAEVYRAVLAPPDGVVGKSTPVKVTRVDLGKLINGADPDLNVEVFPQDRVVVERAGIFYVMGEVNRPGGYNLRNAQEQLTVLQALAVAGDVTSTAKKAKAYIIRKDAKAARGREEIALNLPAILAGRARDEQMQADDILYIPASGRRRALRGFGSAAQAVVGPTAAGLVIYRR